MRIVSGRHRGRILKSPEGSHIRPTSDKIRLAIFNALRARISLDGVIVLDAFCGTGALALEALSQGARQAIFIDSDSRSLALSKANAVLLGETASCTFRECDAVRPGSKPEGLPSAGLCFLDPPYRRDLVTASLNSLHENGWLQADCLIVAEMEKSTSMHGLNAQFDRCYGDTRIVIGKAERI
jgi:16S rRNA (guanine966-N2)-methyltransferase